MNCQNTVLIMSHPKLLKDIEIFMEGNYPIINDSKEISNHSMFCFHKGLPIPPHILESKNLTNIESWCLRNWGTNGKNYIVTKSWDSPRLLIYNFITINNTCSLFLRNLSFMFPKLDFVLHYLKESNGENGKFRFKKGVQVS